jgi:hypothetical protein
MTYQQFLLQLLKQAADGLLRQLRMPTSISQVIKPQAGDVLSWLVAHQQVCSRGIAGIGSDRLIGKVMTICKHKQPPQLCKIFSAVCRALQCIDCYLRSPYRGGSSIS